MQEGISDEPMADTETVPGLLSVPSRDGNFLEVTALYGKLLVREGDFVAEAEVKPWSAWWLPIKDKYLFEATPPEMSPLQKYDLYNRQIRKAQSGAAIFEKNKLYDPNANNWEGLCDAWAVASVLEPEPEKSISHGRITFGIGDQKALLIKTYENVQGARKFGQRYNGDRISVYDDIYAEQFHRFVQVELFENQRAFIMDKDPGTAIWNTPVWRASLNISADASDANQVHVDAWLSGASPFVTDYDYKGTLSVTFHYTYDLFGHRLPDGSFEVAFGVWTNDSLDYHPDFVSTLPDKATRSSRNKEIDLNVVNEILGTRD